MKKILYILLLLIPIVMGGAPKKKTPASDIMVAVCNLASSDSRAQDVVKGKAPAARLWSNSAGAVADQLISIDCDVVGLLDVCDSIAGRAGDAGLPEALKARGADYSWLVLSNTRPSLPLEGAYNRTQAILWKTDKYECIDWSINWLAGFHDKNRLPKDMKGDATKSMTWAKLREKATGKEFYFMVANINGASNKVLNKANCENIIKIADEIVVTDGKPSIIVGSFNMHDGTPGYREHLAMSRWFDVYNRLNEETLLAPSELSEKNTRNSPDGTHFTGGRADYVFVDGFGINYYVVIREKFPAADGTPVYPAYGFPVVTKLKF